MPLLRTIIVVGAVIALLPSDRAQQERLQQAAVDAAHWTMTFCERNAKTCDNAGAAWDVFKTKAEFAAVGEARRGIDHYYRSIDRTLEVCGCDFVFGANYFGVLATKTGNMLDSMVKVIDLANGNFEI